MTNDESNEVRYAILYSSFVIRSFGIDQNAWPPHHTIQLYSHGCTQGFQVG